MPARDGRGPDGKGPTGRKLGPCTTDKKTNRRNLTDRPRRSLGRGLGPNTKGSDS